MKGVLLLNLGTPDSTSFFDVASYLREFLMDGRVLDINPIIRTLLVYGVILPFRTFKTQKAYKSIWLKEGSPLRIHTENLTNKVKNELSGKEFLVKYAMRYGSPKIDSVVQGMLENHSIEELLIIPLFPQYANAATGSAMSEVLKSISQSANIPSIKIINQFYQADFFIEAQAKILESYLMKYDIEHVLFSFHGIPVRQVEKSCGSTCPSKNECQITQKESFCYKQQSYFTAEAIAKKLNLKSYSVGFQSRLGRIPWIKPYTDEELPILAKKYKKIAVSCPSFVADCLETIEEIGDRALEDWKHAGGEELYLIPCVNDSDVFVKGICKLVK